jgi:hypothetical protein
LKGSATKLRWIGWFLVVLGVLGALWIAWEIWFGLTQAR